MKKQQIQELIKVSKEVIKESSLGNGAIVKMVIAFELSMSLILC
jgi:hypothetical protein